MSHCTLPERWWRDRDVLAAEHDKHGSLERTAAAHGPSPQTLYKWWRRLDLPEHRPGPKVGSHHYRRDTLQDEEPDAARVLSALTRLKRPTLEQLADELDMAPRRVRAHLADLQHSGYQIDDAAGAVLLQRVPRPDHREHERLFDGDTYRFAVISDVHLSSRHCRLEELHIAYDRVASEGITDVYNPGDITAGRGIFKGQDHEIVNFTFQSQVQFAVDNYPARDNVTTFIISGNHDCEGEFGRAGADACLAVANERSDLSWCGRYAADFKLPNGAVMTMRHPMGGSSYAKSYKPQKFAESFESGMKPAICLFGHWHNWENGWHRSIWMMNCGTFEGYGGSLGARVPLGEPAVGFTIVEIRLAEDGSVVAFKPEWIPFYHGRRSP